MYDMMRYFFKVCDVDGVACDEEGFDLTDAKAARAHAIAGARSLLAEDIKSGSANLNDFVEVSDEAGGTLFRVRYGEAVEISGR